MSALEISEKDFLMGARKGPWKQFIQQLFS
jgi:hypothetical protein